MNNGKYMAIVTGWIVLLILAYASDPQALTAGGVIFLSVAWYGILGCMAGFLKLL